MLAVAGGAPPRAEKAGFEAVSPLGAGALLKRDGVCDCAPPGAAPKSGFAPVSAAVVGVVDSAGLFAPNRPPVGAAGVGAAPPKAGLEAAPPPKRLLDGCEVVGVVDGAVVEGVAEAGFAAPKRLLGGFNAGGGPAGVVELLPNKDPPAGAGVAVEAALPNKLPPVFGAPPPNSPLLAGWLGVVDSAGLLGVWLPAPPNSDFSPLPA